MLTHPQESDCMGKEIDSLYLWMMRIVPRMGNKRHSSLFEAGSRSGKKTSITASRMQKSAAVDLTPESF